MRPASAPPSSSALGGKSDIPGDAPFEGEFLVEALSDGRLTATGPFYGGSAHRLGPSACLRIGGVRIVVASRKAQMADQEMYPLRRHRAARGGDPGQQKLGPFPRRFRADRRDDPRLRRAGADAGRSGRVALEAPAARHAHRAERPRLWGSGLMQSLSPRHCEPKAKRIHQRAPCLRVDWFAALAMTARRRNKPSGKYTKLISRTNRTQPMPLLAPIEAYADELTAIRRDIHAHPEIGFEEVRTSGIVAEKLQGWGIETHRGIGRTGVVGVLHGTRGDGPAHRPARRHGRPADGRDDQPALPLDHSRALPWLRP